MEDGPDKMSFEQLSNIASFLGRAFHKGQSDLSELAECLEDQRQKNRFRAVSAQDGCVVSHWILGVEHQIILN